MKYFVNYSIYQYEGVASEIFYTEEEVIKFLNKHAENPNFYFSVVYGKVVEFEAVEMIKIYKIKK